MGATKYPQILNTLISYCNSTLQHLIIVDACDPEFPILDVNNGFEKLTGYTREEVIGKNPRFLQGDKTDKDSLVHFKEEMKKGNRCSAYVLNYRKDGSTFWNHFSIIPINDGHGKMIFIAGILNDVSSIVENVKSQSEMNSMVALVHNISDMMSNYMDYLKFFRTYLEEEIIIPRDKLQEFDSKYFYLMEDIKHLNQIERFNEILEWNDSIFHYSK